MCPFQICYVTLQTVSEREVILLEGKLWATLGVELGKPSSMFKDEFILPDQKWFEDVLLVVPGYHVSLQLQDI